MQGGWCAEPPITSQPSVEGIAAQKAQNTEHTHRAARANTGIKTRRGLAFTRVAVTMGPRALMNNRRQITNTPQRARPLSVNNNHICCFSFCPPVLQSPGNMQLYSDSSVLLFRLIGTASKFNNRLLFAYQIHRRRSVSPYPNTIKQIFSCRYSESRLKNGGTSVTVLSFTCRRTPQLA